MSISKLRSVLYFTAKILGDVSAVSRLRIGRRIGQRIAGKITGRLFRKIFR